MVPCFSTPKPISSLLSLVSSFVRAEWTQPPGMRVSRIRLSGRVMEGDKELEAYEGPCIRGDSDWLSDASWGWNADSRLVCFAKLKAVLAAGPNFSQALLGQDPFSDRMDKIRFEDGAYQAWAVRAKMRYVSWIEDMADQILSLIRYPFERNLPVSAYGAG